MPMMLRKRWFLLIMVGKLIRNFGGILQFASICRVRMNAPFFVQHFIFVILLEKITACCFLDCGFILCLRQNLTVAKNASF